MKKLIIVLFVLPLLAAAQSKQSNRGNTMSHLLSGTTPVMLIKQDNEYAAFALVLEDTSYYVEMSGTNIGSATIDAEDKLTISFENSKQVVLKPAGLQSFTPSLLGNKYKHRYIINESSLHDLRTYRITTIRKTMLNDYLDFRLDKRIAEDIKNQSNTLVNELGKKKRERTVFSVGLDQLADHIGDSVLLCSNVFLTRFFESQKSQAMILDFQYSLSGPEGRVIIWKEDQIKFHLPSKSFFTKKDICVRGVVYLYDGMPYIQVTHPSQITIVNAGARNSKAL